MQGIVSHFAGITPASTRVFSTSTHLYEAIRTLRTPRYLALLHKETQDPLWRLLDVLRRPKYLFRVSEALYASGVTIDEYRRWKPLLSENNIGTALRSLKSQGYELISIQDTPKRPPFWVLCYVLQNKVRSFEHASSLLIDIVNTNVEQVAKEKRGPLLLLSTVQLARFNLVVPLRRVAEIFLSTWIEKPSIYFNLMLQVISCIPNRTVETANIAILLLRAMEGRHLTLTLDTYQALLNDRFVTLQLTKYLQSRMAIEGVVPDVAHLEAFLRIFAKEGVIHDARRYFKAIHAQAPEPDPIDAIHDPHSIPQNRTNYTMYSGHQSRTHAVAFLRKLRRSPTFSSSTPINEATVALTRIMHRNKTDHHTLTANLYVALRDPEAKARHLVKMFRKAKGARPTVATYTILIRGLLLRDDINNAVSYWKRLLKSGLMIDQEALATGLVTVTKAHKPHEAFELLERYAGKPEPDPIAKIPLRQPISVVHKTMNDFMVALNRIRRPDVVFRLWDNMAKLYDIGPNSLSLSILLQSARLAAKLDNTLSAAIAQLSPFRRRKPSRLPETRKEAAASIRSLLYDSERDTPVSYKSGIWNNQLPTTVARKVFLQALFGMAQEQSINLFDVESPASAARPSFDSDPVNALGFPRVKPIKYKFEPFPDLLRPDRRTQFPTITVTNNNCFDYIALLGSDSRAVEIPLVLAWMRKLGLRPSPSTLGLALAFWGEVSIQAPLVESWQGGPEKGEYAKLVEWIKDWVGERILPDARLMAKWRTVAVQMRERR